MSNIKKKTSKKSDRALVLSGDNWVYQANAINSAISDRASVIGIRFFSIYQSKLNPKDKTTRKVTFPLDDYAKIMELQRVNITQLKKAAEELITIPIIIGRPDGGFTARPLYDKVDVFQDEQDDWYVTIDCHDDMVDYLFDLHRDYFKYRLWNMLRLRERNHQRMYLFLKERQFLKEPPIVELGEIRKALGLNKDQYTAWRDFRRAVLEPCQTALSERTDLKFAFEPIKKGRGGKIVAIKLIIENNNNYVDQLTLDEFIGSQFEPEYETEEINPMSFKAEEQQELESSTSDYDYRKALALLGEKPSDKPNEQQAESIKNLALKVAKNTYDEELETSKITLNEALYKIIYDAVMIVNTAIEKAKQGKGRVINNPITYLNGVLQNKAKVK